MLVGEIDWKPIFGGVVLLLILMYIASALYSQWMAMEKDLRLALTMIFFVWILNWARKNLSARVAVVYALVLAYIVFFKHPSVVWWIFGIIILTTFGMKMFEKMTASKKEKDKILEAWKEAKPTIIVTMPGPAYPSYPQQPAYWPGQQQQRGGR